MTWQLLAAIGVFSGAAGSLMQRLVLSTKKSPNPVSFAVAFQVLVAVFLCIFVLFRGFQVPDFSILWPYFALTTLLYMGGNILKFKALKKVEISEFVILFQTTVITSVIIAIFLLGESFSLTNFTGLVLVIAAVILVTWKKTQLKLTRHELIALASAVFLGAAFVNDAYILRNTEVFSYAFLAFLLPGLATLIVYNKQVSKASIFEKTIVKKVFLAALFYAIAAISVYSAYQVGRNAAQLSAIFNTQTIVVVILAAIFLKEKDRLERKVIAAIMSIIGVILLG